MFCFNKATLGREERGLCMGTAYQKEQVVIRNLEFSASLILRRGEGITMELIAYHACMRKSS